MTFFLRRVGAAFAAFDERLGRFRLLIGALLAAAFSGGFALLSVYAGPIYNLNDIGTFQNRVIFILMAAAVYALLLMLTLLAQPVSAARWNGTGIQADVMLAVRDPDELPIIPAPVKPVGIRGDADGNGIINYMDALLVLRHSVGLEVLTGDAVECCDVDRSGDLSYMDALLILRYSVGLEDRL